MPVSGDWQPPKTVLRSVTVSLFFFIGSPWGGWGEKWMFSAAKLSGFYEREAVAPPRRRRRRGRRAGIRTLGVAPEDGFEVSEAELDLLHGTPRSMREVAVHERGRIRHFCFGGGGYEGSAWTGVAALTCVAQVGFRRGASMVGDAKGGNEDTILAVNPMESIGKFDLFNRHRDTFIRLLTTFHYRRTREIICTFGAKN